MTSLSNNRLPNEQPGETPPRNSAGRLGLYVLLGVAAGVVVGLTFRGNYILPGVTTADLGDAGKLVITMLKTVAVPLILFGILDAILRTDISWRSGRNLLGICLFNVSIAFVIGLTLMNTIQPGRQVEGHLQEVLEMVKADSPAAAASARPLKAVNDWFPNTPNICYVALLGIAGGALIRTSRNRQLRHGRNSLEQVQQAIAVTYEALMRLTQGIIRIVPFAVFGLIAFLVSRSGLVGFQTLWVFLLVVLVGMTIHAVGYYPAAAYIWSGLSPRRFLKAGSDAVITSVSTNSSLATVPVTLNCLTKKLGISEASARLSACMGTNLNNDGITLYEAMAALFLAQACGFELGFSQQATIVIAALIAGVGVAGIPEAGLIVLPVVLAAAGLPEATIAAALPLLVSIDWILARARSAVNVMSDMTVAVLLDGRPATAGSEPPPPGGLVLQEETRLANE